MKMKFLTNEPVMLIEKTLVIADLHIGIEYEFRKTGIRIPSQTEKMKERIEKILKETKAKKIILLGDVKHKVPGASFQELREIPDFLEYFSKKTSIEIVPGNHDSGLKEFVPIGVKIHPSSGFLFKGLYFNHGHTWPSEDLLKATTVIIGHSHPLIEFKDELGFRFLEPVWVKAKLSPRKIKEKYGEENELKLIIMPAFNEFAGGMPINKISEGNKEFLGPLSKIANMETAEIYLLDGTFLGKLKNL